MVENPTITVVTVVYNAEDSIERTLESVKEQSYSNIEYIVVDGGSKDGTVRCIEAYRDIIAKFISEADEGIYDAMNKAANLATGDYITYLNAGDTYYTCDVIDKVFSAQNITEHDVIYGSNYYHKNNNMILQEPRSLSLFYRGMPFNHQSVFVRTFLVKKYLFNIAAYRIQCEFDFLLTLYLKKYKFYKSDEVISIYEAGGFSDENFLERTLERWLIIKRAGICDDIADNHYHALVARSLGVNVVGPTKNKRASLFKRLFS